MSADGAAKRVPIREGLFIDTAPDGKPKLIGSRCRETGEVFFPREAMSPALMRPGTLEDHPFDGGGCIVAFTTVQRGLPGFDSPYALAAIQLDAGPSLIAQLHGWQGKALAPGMRLELVIERIRQEKDGTVVVGPKFRPLD